MATTYTKQIISDYCVIDTEITGLSAYYDEVIEIGILRVRNDKVVAKYAQLIKPDYEISAFITGITGITNEMVAEMPKIKDVKDDVLSFIGNDIILGHNTSFDIRFLNKAFEDAIDNLYMDTMQFARMVYPELEHHRLSDLSKYLGIAHHAHRSLEDCMTTKQLYDAIKYKMNEKGLTIDNLWTKDIKK